MTTDNKASIFFLPEKERPFPFNREGRGVRRVIRDRHSAGESIVSLMDDYYFSEEVIQNIVWKDVPF